MLVAADVAAETLNNALRTSNETRIVTQEAGATIQAVKLTPRDIIARAAAAAANGSSTDGGTSGSDGGSSAGVVVPVEGTDTQVEMPLSLFASSTVAQEEDIAMVVTVFNVSDFAGGGGGATVSAGESSGGTATVEVKAGVNVDLMALAGNRKLSVDGLLEPIKITMPTNYTPGLECAYWDEQNNVWSSEGVTTRTGDGPLVCETTHLSLFGAIFRGFTATFECSQVKLFNEESVGNILKGDWYSRPGAMVYWAVLALLLVVFVMGAIMDSRHKNTSQGAWSDESFLFPVYDGPREAGEVREDFDIRTSKKVSKIKRKSEMEKEQERELESRSVLARCSPVAIWHCIYDAVGDAISSVASLCRSRKRGADSPADGRRFGMLAWVVEKATSAMLLSASKQMTAANLMVSSNVVTLLTKDDADKEMPGDEKRKRLTAIRQSQEALSQCISLELLNEARLRRGLSSSTLSSAHTILPQPDDIPTPVDTPPELSNTLPGTLDERPSEVEAASDEGGVAEEDESQPEQSKQPKQERRGSGDSVPTQCLTLEDDPQPQQPKHKFASSTPPQFMGFEAQEDQDFVHVPVSCWEDHQEGAEEGREGSKPSVEKVRSKASSSKSGDARKSSKPRRPASSADVGKEQSTVSARSAWSWANMHQKYVNELHKSLDQTSWNSLPRMIRGIFFMQNPFGIIFVFDLFATCKMRALFFGMEITGSFMVCSFFASVSTIGGQRRGNDCTIRGIWEYIGRFLAIGLASLIIAGIPVMLVQMFQTRDIKTFEYEGCPEWKRQLRRWRMQTVLLWIVCLAYIGATVFVVVLILANIDPSDHDKWTVVVMITASEDVLLIPLAIALAIPLVTCLMLSISSRLRRTERSKVIDELHGKVGELGGALLSVVSNQTGRLLT